MYFQVRNYVSKLQTPMTVKQALHLLDSLSVRFLCKHIYYS